MSHLVCINYYFHSLHAHYRYYSTNILLHIVASGELRVRHREQTERKKMGRKKKKREASRRRIRCFHPLINGFLKQSTSEEPADQ